jgi:YD repeat-containing protein
MFVSTGHIDPNGSENGGEPESPASFWRHTGQGRVIPIQNNSGAAVAVQSEDGSLKYFQANGTPIDGGSGTDDRLTPILGGGGQTIGWRHRSAGSGIDDYNALGRLASSVSLTGQVVTVGYSDASTPIAVASQVGLPIRLTDSFGRSIALNYDAQGKLIGATDAAGVVTGYRYGALDNPTAVDYPGGVSRTYRYSDGYYPHFLTGVVDENGVDYVTWTFSHDPAGQNPFQVTSELAGGVDRYKVSTTVTTAGTVSSTVTDPLGVGRNYAFNSMANGVGRLTSQSQPAGSGCYAAVASITYDASGNVDSRIDFDSHKICYQYDPARNLEVKRVEGLSSGANCATVLTTPPAPTAANPTRVISTQWHPDWRLESKRAEAKKVTTWVYNGQPDPTAGGAVVSCAPGTALLPDGKPIAVLCKKVEQATTDATGASGFAATVTGSPRVWTWTYNGYGQMLTAKGPRTDLDDTTTYTYYSDTTASHTLGDLWKLTNAAGHVTEYTRYDPNGRLLEMKDPNGLVTTLSYSPRGWLKTRQVGTALTSYDYDAVGQLKKVTLADGSWIGYDYDPAHRLTDIYDQTGNRITYTLDAAGNRTREDVKDPAGALARTHTRVYDALSRVQNLIQPQ